jgi:putative ABC transport system substrate-binding protein
MHRRRALLGFAALTLAPLARGQAPDRLPRVAALCFGSPGNAKTRMDAFYAGMRQLGYVEGRGVRYDARYANGQRDLLAGLAAGIVARKPDVIVSGSTLVTPPLMQATAAIPIVMVTAEEALATTRIPTRPAPNVTGTVNNALEQVPRTLTHLVSVVQGATHIAVLLNTSNAAHGPYRAAIESAARAARLRCDFIEAPAKSDIQRAIERAAATAPAMMVTSDAAFYDERRSIAELAMMNRIPVIYPQRGYVDAGGLMSYGYNAEQGFARAADFVDRLLKGAKPADLPLEWPSKGELVINRYAAANLGLAIPPEVLKRADRVVG